MPPVSQFDLAVITSDARARQRTNLHNYCTFRSRDAASSAGISKMALIFCVRLGLVCYSQPKTYVKRSMPLEMAAKEATRDTIFLFSKTNMIIYMYLLIASIYAFYRGQTS